MKRKYLLFAAIAVVVAMLVLAAGIFLGRKSATPDSGSDTAEVVEQPDDTEATETPERTEEPEAEEKSEFPKTMYINTEDGLMLRKGPGTENDIIQLLKYGDEISVEKIEDGWAYTTVGDNSGWCSVEYLTEDRSEIKDIEPSGTSSDPGKLVQPKDRATEGYHGYVDEPDGLNLRYGPGTDYDVITAIPDKAEVVEYGWEDGWIFVDYKGTYGWINGQYLLFQGGKEKPVIYLYPTHPMDVDVKVSLTDGVFTETIPESDGEWTVTAEPDGTLTDKATGKKYDYIYWESSDSTEYDWSEGFIVEGMDVEAFLKATLPRMGLNEKEGSEFISYWLPRMEKNKYNLISFQTDRYTDSAKLDIVPKPDSVLRVFMAFKEVSGPYYIPAQKIVPFERSGFTAVEWGGAEVR